MSDANLVRNLPAWLKMAGSHSKCVLVFDALNQLDDGSGEEGKLLFAGTGEINALETKTLGQISCHFL